MASLTPGVLSKLLENVGNKEAKVAGEHRTALLQVIGIVPALVGGDPWQSRGFFLRVSDSVHSAYVAISDDENELILSDKIQLGQFIYVDRFDRGPGVPVVRGVRPVSKRRACVGDPKDLISSDLLPVRTRLKETVMVSRSPGAGGKLRRAENEVVEPRRLSLDSARRGWDRSPVAAKNSTVSKTKEATMVIPMKKSSAEKDSTSSKPPNPAASPLKNSNARPKPTSGKKTSDNGVINGHLVKVPLNFKTWCAPKVAWDSLPRTIQDHGRDTLRHRNSAFLAAIFALTESSAAEAALQCMSTFDELIHSSRKEPPGSIVERFLNLHHAIEKSATTADSILHRKRLDHEKSHSSSTLSSFSQACESLPEKNAISWILAAVESDLSKPSLYRRKDDIDILNKHKRFSNGENRHIILLEKGAKNETVASPSNNNKRIIPLKKPDSIMGKHDFSNVNLNNNAMKDILNLSQKLILSSRLWFLRYMEDMLSGRSGFGLGSGEPGLDMGGLLVQLRKVDKWLEGSLGNGDETDEKIERLRKTLYGFLLEHVDSALLQ